MLNGHLGLSPLPLYFIYINFLIIKKIIINKLIYLIMKKYFF